MAESKGKEERDYTNIVLAVAVLLVFALVFFLVSGMRNSDRHVLNGITVYSKEKPFEEMTRIFSNKTVLLQENLVGGNSSLNSIVAIQSAQIANAFRSLNRTMFVYGVVDGVPQIECSNYTNNCTGASIVVGVGRCNCIRVENGVVFVEGTEEWFSDNGYANVMRVAGVVGGAALEASRQGGK